ncbi:hypothetical protein E3N88_11912 [Mikania micrantha]|uniref:Reverse transcriptase domain-containing protein n=1 Tax=Mikania micrantha TaxID=192012 RepID=A0A5N6P608_9ASTR|nr:hypothetical protein E3N88_11912 [Mikania micrantha]
MLFVDDIVLVAEKKEELNVWIEEWRAALEQKGLRIIGQNYLYYNFSRANEDDEDDHVTIEGQEVPRTTKFKYLESFLQDDGDIDSGSPGTGRLEKLEGSNKHHIRQEVPRKTKSKGRTIEMDLTCEEKKLVGTCTKCRASNGGGEKGKGSTEVDMGCDTQQFQAKVVAVRDERGGTI